MVKMLTERHLWSLVALLFMLPLFCAKVTLTSSELGTRLLSACREGNLTGVQQLIEAGADVNYHDMGGNTPLSIAAQFGSAALVQQLLKAGADVHQVDICGSTPLLNALRQRHVGAVTLLVKAGANLRQTLDGKTIWEWATEAGMGLQLARALTLSLPTAAEPIPLGEDIPKPKQSAIARYEGHYPVHFIIDQSRDGGMVGTLELHYTRFSYDAFVRTLLQLLNYDTPIIASRLLTSALLSLMITEPELDTWRKYIKQTWEVYNVEETQFTIWLPKAQRERYKILFNMEPEGAIRLIDITNPEHILQYCPAAINQTDDPRTQLKPYQKQNLYKIFKTNSSVAEKHNQATKRVVDLIIDGHGSPATSMAGLPIATTVPEEERITSLLSFFNDEMSTGVVALTSCSAGGQNATLLQTTASGIPLNNNFITIIAAISDRRIPLDPTRDAEASDQFFAKAAELEITGDLEGLTSTMYTVCPFSDDPGGYAGIPQIRMPGGAGFQALDVDKVILVAGQTLVTTHEQEQILKQPIEIADKQVVLWYPSAVYTPIKVRPTRPIRTDICGRLWDQLFWNRLLSTADEIIAPSLPVGAEHPYPYLAKHYLREQASSARKLSFPQWEIMRGCAYFETVVVEDSNSPFLGVMRFIRDSFGSALSAKEPRDVVIGSLRGRNDLVLQMKTVRTRKCRSGPRSKLEQLADKIDTITLENVLIRINPGNRAVPPMLSSQIKTDEPGHLEIYFDYGGKHWMNKVSLQGEDNNGDPLLFGSFTEVASSPAQAIGDALQAASQKEQWQLKISHVLERKMERVRQEAACTESRSIREVGEQWLKYWFAAAVL